MKTVEAHKSTTSQSQIQTKQQPFFSKEGERGFFSKSAENTTPFFKVDNAPLAGGGIQPRLTIGKPNDKYEVEADAMADKVVQRLSESKSNSPLEGGKGDVFNYSGQGGVQTKCATCKEKEKLQKKEEDEVSENDLEVQRKPIFESNAEQPEANVQAKPVAPFIQTKCAACEQEEKLQKKEEEVSEESVQLKESEEEIQAKDINSPFGDQEALQSRLNSSKGGGNPLSPDIQSSMGSAIGADFSNVRVHTGSESVQMNKELGAQAFTHGSDIHFSQGKYDTNSSSGKHLLAHELTHTMQQGSSKGTVNARLDNSIQLKEANSCEKKDEGGSEAKAAANETAPPASCAQSNPPVQQPPEGQEEPDREEVPANVESREGAPVNERQGHAPPADQNAPASEQGIQEGTQETEQPLGPCELREQQNTGGVARGQAPATQNQQPVQNNSEEGNQSQGEESGTKKGKGNPNKNFIQAIANKGISPMIVKNGLGEQASPELLVERDMATSASHAAWEGLLTTRNSINNLSSGKLEFRKPDSEDKDTQSRHSQSSTIATQFLTSSANRSNAMISEKLGSIDGMKKEIATKKNAILADIEGKKVNSKGFFAGARKRASKKAQISKNVLEGHHAVTLLQIEIKALLSKMMIQQHHLTKKAELDQKYTDQIATLNQTYQTAYSNLITIGNNKGRVAVTKGNEKARSYRRAEGASASIQNKVQNRVKDGFWDGYLTYNRYMARADAAKEVGKQYSEGMKEQAKAQADKMLCGKGKDLEMAMAIHQVGGENLQCALDNAMEGIDRRKQAAVMQATHAKQELFTTIDNSLKATINQLKEKEAIQLQLLNDYGIRQIMAIEKDGETAITSTLRGINEAAQQLLLFLQEYKATISGSETPEKKSFTEDLKHISINFDQSLQNTRNQVDQSVQNGSAAIRQAETNALIAIQKLYTQGVTDGKTVVTSFNTVIDSVQSNGISSYTQLLTITNQGIQGELESGNNTMNGVVTGIGGLFTQITNGLEARFTESATQMENGMQSTLDNDLDVKICSEAEKAAADVQPWWKTALKILLVIIVIVVVALVIGPAVIGAVGAAASALAGSLGAGAALAGTIGAWAGPIIGGAIVGALSGAVIQVGNNLIDIAGTDKELSWDNVTKGVWGAMIAGAIGGALGGLGGQFAQVIMGRLGAGLSGGWQFVSQFGIEGAFDVVGGILGDLAAGNPITWQSIAMGLAIGGAVQVGMGGMSSLARRSAQTRVGGVNVDAPTAGGFKARAGRAAERITDFQGRMMEAGQNFGGRAGFGRNAPSVDATKQGIVDANTRMEQGEFFPTKDVDSNAPRTDVDGGARARNADEQVNEAGIKPTEADHQRVIDPEAARENGSITQQDITAERSWIDGNAGLRRPSKLAGYTEEIELPNGHIWRRNKNGGWCRFSTTPLLAKIPFELFTRNLNIFDVKNKFIIPGNIIHGELMAAEQQLRARFQQSGSTATRNRNVLATRIGFVITEADGTTKFLSFDPQRQFQSGLGIKSGTRSKIVPEISPEVLGGASTVDISGISDDLEARLASTDPEIKSAAEKELRRKVSSQVLSQEGSIGSETRRLGFDNATGSLDLHSERAFYSWIRENPALFVDAINNLGLNDPVLKSVVLDMASTRYVCKRCALAGTNLASSANEADFMSKMKTEFGKVFTVDSDFAVRIRASAELVFPTKKIIPNLSEFVDVLRINTGNAAVDFPVGTMDYDMLKVILAIQTGNDVEIGKSLAQLQQNKPFLFNQFSLESMQQLYSEKPGVEGLRVLTPTLCSL